MYEPIYMYQSKQDTEDEKKLSKIICSIVIRCFKIYRLSKLTMKTGVHASVCMYVTV
jgi:hypothetical protein